MIPRDPAILLSFINQRLRDKYSSLKELCDDLQLDEQEIIARLAVINYEYDCRSNRFH